MTASQVKELLFNHEKKLFKNSNHILKARVANRLNNIIIFMLNIYTRKDKLSTRPVFYYW